MLQDRKTVRKLRAALDQHTSPNPKAMKPRSFPRLSPSDDERKFERFVRAIRQCSNLSDARRFRSEVASQLKRESMMDGQDQTFLRRLETGKILLDQRVGQLGAAGGVSLSRPRQPDFRNGVTESRLVNASITEILRDASGLSYFMEYMDRQKMMTLVEFWIVVEGFRNPLEEDITDETSAVRPRWTDADRTDIAQIYEAYLLRPELKVSEQSRDVVKSFLKAGRSATMSQYLNARSVVLKAQTANLELMRERHFPSFKRSDLYYKYLTSDDSSSTSILKLPGKAFKAPSVDPIPESPTKAPLLSRLNGRTNASAVGLRRNASSNNDLISSAKLSELISDQQSRRSLEEDRASPLFEDERDNELLSRSTQSIDSESLNAERDYGNREQMMKAMEAALNDIMTDDKKDDGSVKPLFEPFESSSPPAKQPDSPRSSGDFVRIEASSNDKDRGRPNLASLGLVNTSSRIGVFTDNDLFDDEEKFIEDEHADPEVFPDEKSVDDEIHQAAPGDLGLAEAISALTVDIERLIAQESVVDTLTRKAELTNNGAELRILGKSRSSLQREIRRKELQRRQYIVQESDNSLFGRANVEIKSVMVGKDADGQEFALYVIEVQRKAGENMAAASWAVARRYSEFHDLHQRLRNIYPVVRQLEFPRRRLVMKLQREFLHKRRISLENYLRELLRHPAVCSSRDLRAFLSQQAIIPDPDASRAGERRDIVSRIYNSVTDGMDEFLGNLPVLDQLSVAGQNLISAATSQFNTMSPAGSAPEEEVTIQSAEAHAELLAFENRDVEPFVKPICDLFLETFELNRDHNWLRGRAVVVVLHQLLGGTVERKIRDCAHAVIAEDSLLKYIGLIKDTMWPGGGLLRTESAVRTATQKQHSRREASVMLATLIPDLAGHVVGRANAQAASRRVFATVNNQRLNTHLAFTVLDEMIRVLFPEVR
jgi:sorting nexin-25